MSKQWKIVDHPSIPGMIVIEGPAFRLVTCAQAINITSSDYLQIMADARLIAAAPEMYELLANLAAVCDSWDEDYENDEQRADAFWHMARIAKVLLLTKIEGGGDNG